MARCSSRYQNRNEKGEPLGEPIRCTAKEGHIEETPAYEEPMHRNFAPGHKIKWPESAAMSDA